MESKVGISAQARLDQVCGDLDRWRQTRAKAGPIPEPLWDAATSLSRELGLYSVARAARLNYAALKERAAKMTDPIGRRALSTAPAKVLLSKFVEVSGVPPPSGSPAEGAVVEVVGADGARLTIRFPGEALDVAALVNAFQARR